jgi:hypothetical protein
LLFTGDNWRWAVGMLALNLWLGNAMRSLLGLNR